jgi:hypothetical protein
MVRWMGSIYNKKDEDLLEETDWKFKDIEKY